jgi:TetR/AcrR family transcriptional repressor of nem operon
LQVLDYDRDRYYNDAMKTKKGEKEKLRIVILEKVLAILKKHGRSGAGINKLMEQAGLTTGALYSHFKSKDEMFAQAVCHDLKKLEISLTNIFEEEGPNAFKVMIERHLSEENLLNVSNSCVFTSLSTDMQRSKASHRAAYELIMLRIYKLMADHFKSGSSSERMAKATNLYSSLIGTLGLARTMKSHDEALVILSSGRKFLIQTFAAS